MTQPLIRHELASAVSPDPRREVHWLHPEDSAIPTESTETAVRPGRSLDMLRAIFGIAATKLHEWRAQTEVAERVVTKSVIGTDDIGELTDPNLRYALRFAAAAQSLGAIGRARGHSTGHRVTVIATNEKFDSKLIVARYSGDEEHDFMSDLKTAGPE